LQTVVAGARFELATFGL